MINQAFTAKPCKHHKPHKLDYLRWIYWAYAQEKRGHTQTQCPSCGRWYYPSEMGKKP